MQRRDRPERVGRSLVDVLLERGAPECITTKADEFYAPRRLGEWLVNEGLITPQELALALAQQAAERGEYLAAEAHLYGITEDLKRSRRTLLDRFDVAVSVIARRSRTT